LARKNLMVLAVVIALFATALWIILPIQGERLGRQGMRLGLDLVGGVHLVYQAQFPEGATSDEKARDMDRALETIQNRIDKYGVVEPIIQKQENERIMVQLPGFTDMEAAKSLVEQTGFLEFREVEVNSEGNAVYLSEYLEDSPDGFFNNNIAGNRLFTDEGLNPLVFIEKDGAGNLTYTDEAGESVDIEEIRNEVDRISKLPDLSAAALLSWVPARGDDGTPLTGNLLMTAVPDIQSTATGIEAEVAIEWDETGSIIFDQIAERLYNSGPYGIPQRALGIFLDNSLLSYPQILESSYNGKASITGNFSVDEVERLSNLLESGALPMPLEKPPLYEEKISATLGANFIDMSLLAGLIGIILVMIFMIAYYRIPGILASIALIFYGTLVMALFKLIPVTLTLAGIGGFVLSIGMAVDANVLIFERMKEEFRAGRTLGAAIETGFNRAWTAIRDSNVTTFIICAILFWLGSSIVASAPVMGFALTLFIGVAVSMFTALAVTRVLLRLFVGTRLAQRISWFTAYSRKEQ